MPQIKIMIILFIGLSVANGFLFNPFSSFKQGKFGSSSSSQINNGCNYATMPINPCYTGYYGGNYGNYGYGGATGGKFTNTPYPSQYLTQMEEKDNFAYYGLGVQPQFKPIVAGRCNHHNQLNGGRYSTGKGGYFPHYVNKGWFQSVSTVPTPISQTPAWIYPAQNLTPMPMKTKSASPAAPVYKKFEQQQTSYRA